MRHLATILSVATLAVAAAACADDGPDAPASTDQPSGTAGAGEARGSDTEATTDGESGTVPGTDGATEPITSIETGSNAQNPAEATVP